MGACYPMKYSASEVDSGSILAVLHAALLEPYDGNEPISPVVHVYERWAWHDRASRGERAGSGTAPRVCQRAALDAGARDWRRGFMRTVRPCTCFSFLQMFSWKTP